MAIIKILDNGPLLVNGDFKLLDGEDVIMETEDPIYLCRCGLADKMPYCDGSHGDKFDSKVRV
jgi:CDGSH iron-sulfur domain-containing protein 3